MALGMYNGLEKRVKGLGSNVFSVVGDMREPQREERRPTLYPIHDPLSFT